MNLILHTGGEEFNCRLPRLKVGWGGTQSGTCAKLTNISNNRVEQTTKTN